VIQNLLEADDVEVSLRSIQRIVEPLRRQQAIDMAVTTRFETTPGAQMQVDFGERHVTIGGQRVRVHFFVATLGYSRCIFVSATLSQRQDEWKLGIEGALQRFGGCPAEVVVDNARALILHHGSEGAQVHPAFEAYCKDRGVHVRACRPYRAQTKGKVESGVKYVKRNAIAGRSFENFAALEAHLLRWMDQADRRVHGTTHRQPIEMFDQAERAALRPLRPALEVTTQRIRRVVSNDCFVDVDTVRYSVPHRLAGKTVDVRMTGGEAIIESAGVEVARHPRCSDAYARVTRPEHFAGIFRRPAEAHAESTPAVTPSVVCQWAQLRLSQWAEVAAQPHAGGAS
jgi:transposase